MLRDRDVERRPVGRNESLDRAGDVEVVAGRREPPSICPSVALRRCRAHTDRETCRSVPAVDAEVVGTNNYAGLRRDEVGGRNLSLIHISSA